MTTTLFLCGDVMIGRGVDQILECPSPPDLHEPHIRDASEYVELAERASGPIPRAVPPSYIWGDALDEVARIAPDARIINLETSITGSDAYWSDKGIHYRMHPGNVACLTAAGIDVCALANNHVLDYGYAGLEDTLKTLRTAGVKTAGAGRTARDAQAPAVLDLAGGRRVLVWSFGVATSGIPPSWGATPDRAGVDLLDDLSEATAVAIVTRVERIKQPGDLIVASIHWGDNWGYDVPPTHTRFAHRLIDGGGADIVHGHSSHHPRPIEVYRNRLILYGCGDFLNDYEGISGYEAFRDDLVLMYFPTLESRTGALVALRMTPMRIRRIRLSRPSSEETDWLRDTLDRVSREFGSRIERDAEGRLQLIPAGM